MKSYKQYITLMLVAVMCITVAGCNFLEQEDLKLDRDPEAEFFPLTQTVSEDDGSTTVDVQLIAAQRSADTSLPFTVDQANTTAIAGTHYNITTPSPAVISANSSETVVGIQIIDGSLADDDDPVVLTLLLQNSSDGAVIASPNLSTAVITIQPS